MELKPTYHKANIKIVHMQHKLYKRSLLNEDTNLFYCRSDRSRNKYVTAMTTCPRQFSDVKMYSTVKELLRI